MTYNVSGDMFRLLAMVVPHCEKIDTIGPIKNKNDLTEIKNDKLVKDNHTLVNCKVFNDK